MRKRNHHSTITPTSRTLLILSLCVLSLWWWLNYPIVIAQSSINDLNDPTLDIKSSSPADDTTSFSSSSIHTSSSSQGESSSAASTLESVPQPTLSSNHLAWLDQAFSTQQNRPCLAQAVKTELVRNAIQRLKSEKYYFPTSDEENILKLLNHYMDLKCSTSTSSDFYTHLKTQLKASDLNLERPSVHLSKEEEEEHLVTPPPSLPFAATWKGKLRGKQIKSSILYTLLEKYSHQFLFENSTLFSKLKTTSVGDSTKETPVVLGPSLKATLLNALSRMKMMMGRDKNHLHLKHEENRENLIHAPKILVQALVTPNILPTSCKYVLFEQLVFNEAIQFFSKHISQSGSELSLKLYNSEANPTDVALFCAGKDGRVGKVDLYEELRKWFSGRRHLIDEMIVWQSEFQSALRTSQSPIIGTETTTRPSTLTESSSILHRERPEKASTRGTEIPEIPREQRIYEKPESEISTEKSENISQQQQGTIYETPTVIHEIEKPTISTSIQEEILTVVSTPQKQTEIETPSTSPSSFEVVKDQDHYATIRPHHKEEPLLTHPRMSRIISQFSKTSMVSQFPLIHSILDLFTIPLTLKRAASIFSLYYLKLVEGMYHLMCLNCAPYQTLSILHLESPGLEFFAHFVTIFSCLVFLILFVDHLNIISFTLFCVSFLMLNVKNLLSLESLADVRGVSVPSGIGPITTTTTTTTIHPHLHTPPIPPSILSTQFNVPFSLFSLYSSVSDKTLFGMMHFLYLPLLSLAFDKKDSSLIFKACILVAASATLMEQVNVVFYTFFKHMAMVLLLAGVARHLVTTIGYTLFNELYSLISDDLIMDKAIFQIPDTFTEEDREALKQQMISHPKSKVVISIDAREENPLIIEAQAVAETGAASTVLHSEIDTNEMANLSYEQQAEKKYVEEQIEILEEDLKRNMGWDEEGEEEQPSIEMANVLA
ncbi:hypothetical protein FDP41_005952 [Naegleria fowleri]|uniref:Uncharacterized protein n=1 Tax=Naegleria fowleri TaxID=5763 RepID=A0A6A5BQF3_NAEFO|nr:uncharacterized protein FDP41_005952 [Naegleria fowleri]KAF0975199.1 hypothetical protein FDP41_005952 [Naegleria fowleri]CAG4717712.1 unnamed protein product [Naegleria fowleri]